MVMNNNNGTSSNFTSYSPFAFEKKPEEKEAKEKKSEEKLAGTAAIMGQLGVAPTSNFGFSNTTPAATNMSAKEKPVEKAAPTYPTTSFGFGGNTFNSFSSSTNPTTFNIAKPAETTTEIKPTANPGSINTAPITTAFGGNVTNFGKQVVNQSPANTTFKSKFDKPKEEDVALKPNGGIAAFKPVSFDKPAGDFPEKIQATPIFNSNSPRKSSVDSKPAPIPTEFKKEEFKPAAFQVGKREEHKPAFVVEKKETHPKPAIEKKEAKPMVEKKEAPSAVFDEKKEVLSEKKPTEVIIEKRDIKGKKEGMKKEEKKEEKVEKAPKKKETKPKVPRPAEATRHSTRARKPVQQVVVDEPAAHTTKEIEIPKGSGIKFGEIEHMNKALQKYPATDSLLQLAHRIIFGKPGESLKRKANLRAFHGFPAGYDMTGMKEKMQKYSVEDLKDLAIFFNLERSGDKNSLVERLTAFLQKPKDFGVSKAVITTKKKATKIDTKGKKNIKQKKSTKKVAGTKRKAPAKKEMKVEPQAKMEIEQPSSEQQQNN